MLEARAQVVFGDFNKRAYLDAQGQPDRKNNTLKTTLETAVNLFQQTTGRTVTFQMLRADDALDPGQSSLAVEAEQDCTLMFLIDYCDEGLRMKDLTVSKSKQVLTNEMLGLKHTDKDWHIPMLVHLRSGKGRHRSDEANQRRKQKEEARRRATRGARR